MDSPVAPSTGPGALPARALPDPLLTHTAEAGTGRTRLRTAACLCCLLRGGTLPSLDALLARLKAGTDAD